MSPDAALTLAAVATAALVGLWAVQKSVEAAQFHALLKELGPRATANLGRPRRFKRRRKEAQLQAEDVGSLCTEVAARLRAGAPPLDAWGAALERAGWDTSGVENGGGRVEDLLASAGPVGDTVVVGMAFSAKTGAPLAGILERLAASVTDGTRTQDAVKVAFAGPKASARVLTFLPLIGLLGGELLGAAPLLWFSSGPLQLLLGSVGLALTAAGYLASQKMIRGALESASQISLAPVFCDLAAAGVTSGLSVPSTLEALGAASGAEGLVHIARELQLGASWKDAWEEAPLSAELLKGALEPAWVDGISPISLLRASADQSRATSVTRARSQAEKLGVKLSFPLGGLLLPAFVVLGLVPVFFSLVAGQFTGFFG